MLDYCFVTHSQALKGDFPVRFDYALKVKLQACNQIIMCNNDTAVQLCAFLNCLVDVRYVKIVHVNNFDDEL